MASILWAGADKDTLDLFVAGFATEDETAAEIKRVMRKQVGRSSYSGYL